MEAEPNMKIPLSGGYFALVDAEDYERVSRFAWKASVRKHFAEYWRA